MPKIPGGAALILHGPSERVLPAVRAESVDLIATDPPYGLFFMGRDWDAAVPGIEIWAECYRVLKPGGFILVMASPRLDDFVCRGLREVGFIRDNSIFWIYGQGFSKGVDVGKRIDSRAVREWLKDKPHGLTAKEINKVVSAAVNGEYPISQCASQSGVIGGKSGFSDKPKSEGAALIARLEAEFGEMPKRVKVEHRIQKGAKFKLIAEAIDNKGYNDPEREGFNITAPATPLAAEWDGTKYGVQALKPAAEVILVFQKPFEGAPLDSILKHGVGCVNVASARIPTKPKTDKGRDGRKLDTTGQGWGFRRVDRDDNLGRYPSNLLISHSPGCRVVGVKRVRTTSHSTGKCKEDPRQGPGGCFGGGLTGGATDYTDADGREEVKEWECVEGCAVAELDRQSGVSKSSGGKNAKRRADYMGLTAGYTSSENIGGLGDCGTASRFYYQPEWSNADDIAPFYYCAKASSWERNAGVYAEGALCDVLKLRAELGLNAVKWGKLHITPEIYEKRKGKLPRWIKKGSYIAVLANRHPTVKPVDLFAYLIKQFIGHGKIVLDPFCGSGTTNVAGLIAGVKVIGIDADFAYCQLGCRREDYWSANLSTYLTKGSVPVVKDAALPLFESEE